MIDAYDIIGDVHGHASELKQLLAELGYRCIAGVYQHPERQAIFVGDLVDRGPGILEVIQIVKGMVDNGHAQMVMGNHEFNMIAYHSPDGNGAYYRAHDQKSFEQHRETLKQMAACELLDAVEWFRQLPLYLELDGFRVVHACWDPVLIEVLSEAVKTYGGVSVPFLKEFRRSKAERNQNSNCLYNAVENVLKGKEFKLPDGESFLDKGDHKRFDVRFKWFDELQEQNFGQFAMRPQDVEKIANKPVDFAALKDHRPYAADERPVFFGHYWLLGDPQLQTPNVCCLDYSVAKKGALVAYRWDGEGVLRPDKFVSVPHHS